MAMEYARRPAVAGKVIPFLQYATLRGSLRRNDPDGSSTDPYFPTPASSTLTVVLDGDATNKTFTFTFPLNCSVASVLSTMNGVLGASPAKGIAYELGGVLYIQTLTKGSTGSVEVTGGTAATSLGFGLIRGPQKSAGGDIPAASEGLVQNPSTASFPTKGENLLTDSFNRGLARLATNADVLYADHARQMPRMAKLGTVAASSQTSLTASSSLVAMPGAPRVFTGYGLLNGTSGKEELANFFILVDTATKRPAQSRVVAVVRGVVSGDPPYGNAPDISTGAGNVLGQSFVRAGPLSIDSIQDGRFVVHNAGGMNVVKVGDLARIDGADGTVPDMPWDNRGLRWIVEWVSADGTAAALRPMSAGELALWGTTVKDNQPVVDLNSTLSAGQSFGTVTFFTGTFLEGLGVVVQPPMPPNASYELWAKVPLTLRDQVGYEASLETSPLARELVQTTDFLFSTPLTRPTLSIAGNIITVGQFYARWHGRVISIPQQTVDLTSYGTAVAIIYWDPADALVKVASPTLANTGGVCPMVYAPTTRSAYSDVLRLSAESQRSATVGSKGQFPTLTQALNFLSCFATNARDHFELVVLENQTAPDGGWVLPSINLRIAAATPDVMLLPGATGPFFTTSSSITLVLEDFVLDLSKTLVQSSVFNPYITYIGLKDALTNTHRAYDAPTSFIDIGNLTSGVNIGSSGHTTAVRGALTVAQTVQMGAAGSGGGGGVGLSLSGQMGQLVLSKYGESDIVLTKDQLDVLVGGAGSYADALHNHTVVASAVAVGSTSAIRTGSDVKSQLEELDTGVRAYTDAKFPALAWTGLTPASPHTASAYPIAFWKDASGVVHVRGAVVAGDSSTTLLTTLPAGARPSPNRGFAIGGSGSATVSALVSGNGNINLQGAPTSGNYYFLDGISFVAEQ